MPRQFEQIFIASLLLLIGCSSTGQCPEGINLLPMYGGQKKCEKQLKIDRDFFAECEKKFKNREDASKFHVDKGWEYFYKNDLETAMKRFNQAWILDSMNADTYWGFGNILGIKHQFTESLPLLEKSIKLNPTNSKVYQSIATSYGQLFFKTKDVALLNKTVDNLKSAIKIDPRNANALAHLTGAYCYFMQKDSARKYLALTDKIDPNAVNSDVRKMLRGQ